LPPSVRREAGVGLAIAAAIKAEREKLLDHVKEIVGDVLGTLLRQDEDERKLLRQELREIDRKLAGLQELWQSTPTPPDPAGAISPRRTN
jgi:hypothetical protein